MTRIKSFFTMGLLLLRGAGPAIVVRSALYGPGMSAALYDLPVLVVNQKWKVIELTNEYLVRDEQGAGVGSVCEVGQSDLKKLVRAVTSYDQFFTHKLEVRDATGTPCLVLTRPRKFVKSRLLVEKPDGTAVGEIVQNNVFGKIRFALSANGQTLGSINAENWRAWNFSIADASGTEIARITKTWEGFAKTIFTTADDYVLQRHAPISGTLADLVLAAALCIDTALKQDSRGLN